MKRPWEKALPIVAAMIALLLVAQFYFVPEPPEPGQVFLHSVPSGARILMPQAGSVAGYNLKELGTTPGPLPLSLKERTRFTFVLELAGYEKKRVYVARDELATSPVIELKPKWGLLSVAVYHLRDYKFAWLALLLGLGFFGGVVRPQLLKRVADEAVWDLGKLQPGMMLHDYRLLKLLGKGAAGAVYLADKPEDDSGSRYTLKVLHRQDWQENDDKVKELEREFKNCGKLFHPSIVYLQDFGTIRGYYYIVFEYVEGTPLNESKLHSFTEVCDWVPMIVAGLEHAHQNGIVHRDIKPANLMLSKDGRIRILDFGISAQVGNSEHQNAAGTVGFMPPEQAKGEVGPANDFYSLGVTIYELIANQLPFAGDNYFQILAAQTKSEYKPLRELEPQCPEALSELVDKLLTLEPDDRITDPTKIENYVQLAKASLTSAAD